MFSLFLAVTLSLPQILASMGETRKDFLRSASSFSYFLALCFISAFPKFIQNRSLQRKCGRTEVAAFVSHTQVPPPAAPDWHCVIPFNLLLLDARSQDYERLRVVAQVCWWEAKWFSGWFSPAREQSLGVAKVSHRGYTIKYKLWLKTTFGLEKQRHQSNSLEQRMYCCHSTHSPRSASVWWWPHFFTWGMLSSFCVLVMTISNSILSTENWILVK